ncbi:MAG: chemotaxis response regulator protein-glutamate methylesterase [Maritimibacter sp.]
MSDRINVMIIDDSASVRTLLSSFIRRDPGLHLWGAANDPLEAIGLLKSGLPDVILLDLHMPHMDGLTFLERLMARHPIPTVVLSSFTRDGSTETMRALELGAVGVLKKPHVGTEQAREEAAMLIADAVRGAAQTRVARRTRNAVPRAPGDRHTADVILPATQEEPPKSAPPLIVIGASTGGTEALSEIFTDLPADLPPIALVQHFPPGFTAAFAERLNRESQLEVFEAYDGAPLGPGQAVVAQGDRHLVLDRAFPGYRVSVRDGLFVTRHRPSCDVLFRSAAQVAGPAALGVLLTGMGDDGATGMGEMLQAGAHTLAQDQASSVVWGMPGVALKRGVAEQAVPLNRMAHAITTWARVRQAEAASNE